MRTNLARKFARSAVIAVALILGVTSTPGIASAVPREDYSRCEYRKYSTLEQYDELYGLGWTWKKDGLMYRVGGKCFAGIRIFTGPVD